MRDSLRSRALLVGTPVAIALGLAAASFGAKRVEKLRVAEPPAKRVVILMIGDGMGPGPLAAASYYRTGRPNGLNLQRLPHQGRLVTAGPDGITDSAAAATAMATGVYVRRAVVGKGRNGERLVNLVDLAHRHGLSAGLVTTTRVTHATPAAFTAHVDTREEESEIARQQALHSRPEVLLGGGATRFFAADGPASGRDSGLIGDLDAAGYGVVRDGRELEELNAANLTGVVGLFAAEHLPFRDSRRSSRVPSLETMAMAAIGWLERDPQGFFLMIEGGRIDMAGHSNDLRRMIDETLAFDGTVAAVARWASGRDGVLLLVTADHDTGGLEVLGPRPAGEYPRVRWRTREHTATEVGIFASGPGTERFDGTVRDHRWIHAVARAHIQGVRFRPPAAAELRATVLARIDRTE